MRNTATGAQIPYAVVGRFDGLGEQSMRERRLVLVAVCNVVVLCLGVAAWATEATGTRVRGVVLGGEREASSAQPATTVGGMADPLAADVALPLPDPSARLSGVPTHELEYLPGGVRQGVLEGSADLDGGCVWIVTEEGQQAVRWPPGFQAAFVPAGEGAGVIELVDASGRVAARSGETVYFTGARSGGAERLERCHVGADHVWYVGSVTAQSPFADVGR